MAVRDYAANALALATATARETTPMMIADGAMLLDDF